MASFLRSGHISRNCPKSAQIIVLATIMFSIAEDMNNSGIHRWSSILRLKVVVLALPLPNARKN